MVKRHQKQTGLEEATKMYCIYKVTNKVNNHIYIGKHKYTDETNPMGRYKGSGTLLKLAYKKYGMDNFTIDVLYKRIRDEDTANAMEAWAITKYKPEYNIAAGGNGGDICSRLPKERYDAWIKKQSDIAKRRIADDKDNFGKPPKQTLSNDDFKLYCLRMSQSLKKVKHTKEWNAAVVKSVKAFYKANTHNSSYGVPFTEQHCKNISEARKGYKWYNNGVISVQAKECPEGFKPGLSPKDKEKRKGKTPWNKGKRVVKSSDKDNKDE